MSRRRDTCAYFKSYISDKYLARLRLVLEICYMSEGLTHIGYKCILFIYRSWEGVHHCYKTLHLNLIKYQVTTNTHTRTPQNNNTSVSILHVEHTIKVKEYKPRSDLSKTIWFKFISELIPSFIIALPSKILFKLYHCFSIKDTFQRTCCISHKIYLYKFWMYIC